MENEIWKDIPGYEGLYQVSSLGQVKNIKTGRILKQALKRGGYLTCAFYKNGIKKQIGINVAVAMAFLNYKNDNRKIVVDHINANRIDNRLSNLQVITQRENLIKRNVENFTSKFPGVYRCEKWSSKICINYKNIHLGTFNNEERAAEIYQLALKNAHLYDGDSKKFRDLIISL